MAEAKLAPNLPDWMVEHANRYLSSGGTDGHMYSRTVPGALPASSAHMRRLYPLRLKIGFAPETRTFSGRACCSAAAISCRRVGGAIRPLR